LKTQHDEIHKLGLEKDRSKEEVRREFEIAHGNTLRTCINDLLRESCGDRNLTCHLNMEQGFWSDETKCFWKLDEITALKNMNLFLNRINYHLYKNAYRRYGKRISIVPSWLERGTSKGDLHYHCLISIPEDRFAGDSEEVRKFWMENLIRKFWFETPYGAPRVGGRETLNPSITNQRVRVDWEHKNSISYLTKFKTKSDLSLIDWENFHWNQKMEKTLLN
jgi:hypothetical protein